MKRTISLAHLTLLELPPPDLIRVAAEAGFASVGLRLIAVTDTTPGYPLMTDRAMLRDTLRAIKETGVSVNDIEFVRMTPEFDPEALRGFLEVGADMGAKYIVTAPYDPDLSRLTDNLAEFSGHSAEFGLKPVLEFFPWTNVPDFPSALRIVEKTGDPSIGVLVDTLHFNRSGSLLSYLTSVDLARLPFIHVCDAPVKDAYSHEELLHTARAARLIPGSGDIPIAEILAHMPGDIPIALEVPLEDRRGSSPIEIARKILSGTEALLERTSLDTP